jgi:hypothetical protein
LVLSDFDAAALILPYSTFGANQVLKISRI